MVVGRGWILIWMLLLVVMMNDTYAICMMHDISTCSVKLLQRPACCASKYWAQPSAIAGLDCSVPILCLRDGRFQHSIPLGISLKSGQP